MKFEIWLLMLNIDVNKKIDLLKKYQKEEIIFDNFNNIIGENNINFKNISEYDKNAELKKAEEILMWVKKNNIGFVTYKDKEYPESLKNIDYAPYGLFYKGDISILQGRAVSIVGSRNCSEYGIQVTKLLTKELNSYNITIISGGARGIDSVAHKTTVLNNGKTVVVLGCGIDIVYPSENKLLFKSVEDTGLIISEFLPGTKPFGYNFPRRNRIISALSEIVIVVEATNKSGSLITANYALDQGKDVMAVPGSIFYKGSTGCNKLIYDGATIFCDMQSLHTLLRLDCKEDNRIISPLKQRILSIVSAEPTHIDEIVDKSFIDRELLFNVLFEMQNRNEIISLPGNYYAKIM